jgi:glucose/arabinose dehydrogenase
MPESMSCVMKRLLLILLVFCLAACAQAPISSTPTVPAATPQPAAPATQPAAQAPSPIPTSSTPASLSPAPTIAVPTATLPPAQPTTPAQALAFPDLQAYTWHPVIAGLVRPIGLVNAADGSGRLFILEQAGQIRILQNGQLLPTPFLDIRDWVGSQGSEQGLLGLAFSPHYPQNSSFFVNYTDKNGDTVIARFQISGDDPNQADPASEKRLIFVKQPFPNHNGGSMAFGPDGYLYLGLGDGGSAGDPHGNGQSLSTLLGKILRIDVDGSDPYAIPEDNPFASQGGKPEIWSYGLRNPWRFSFDRLTGDLYIADVGQNLWEEIDFVPASGLKGGYNFGWNYMEGSHPYQGSPPAQLILTPPVAEYSHDQGCSVTGGVVYRGPSLPAWQGIYLFGDYCSGRVWGLLRTAQGAWQQSVLFENVGQITSFGEDEQGEVYLVDYSGLIYVLGPR